jgi:hypothetical protein
MGVTVTHPLPPLKRGGLGVGAQFVVIPDVILLPTRGLAPLPNGGVEAQLLGIQTVLSVFFLSNKNRPHPDTARLADAFPS